MSWESELEKDLDWRFAELAAIKVQTAVAGGREILQRSLLRALVALLYAHYEGFCKTAIRLYLNEIKKRGVKREDCQQNLAIFSLQKEFRQTKNISSKDCWLFYTTDLKQFLESVIDYELGKDGNIVLEGDSNLYPKLLRANLEAACLRTTQVDTHEKRLNSLVGRRNEIAHGQKNIISNLSTYQEYEDSASAVMYDLAYAIIETLDEETYKKTVVYEG